MAIVVRDLKASDYHKGHLHLLSQLTTVGDVSEEQYVGRRQPSPVSGPVSHNQRSKQPPNSAAACDSMQVVMR